MAKRFRIAFSFAGEKRSFTAEVAEILAKRFGKDHILFDKYHEAEFARSDLALYLPPLYFDQSDLIVVVMCKDYDKREWPSLEWKAVYSLIMKRNEKDVMLCRFDRAVASGLHGLAGFVELDEKTPSEVATLILQRLAFHENKPKDYYTHNTPPIESESPVPIDFIEIPDLDGKLNIFLKITSTCDPAFGKDYFIECKDQSTFLRFYYLDKNDFEGFISGTSLRKPSCIPIELEWAWALRYGLINCRDSDPNQFVGKRNITAWNNWIKLNWPSWRNSTGPDFLLQYKRHMESLINPREFFRDIDDEQLNRCRDMLHNRVMGLRKQRNRHHTGSPPVFRPLMNSQNPLKNLVMIGATIVSNSPAGTQIMLLEFRGKKLDFEYSGLKFEVTIARCVVEIVAEVAFAGSPILGIGQFGDLEPVSVGNNCMVVEWHGVRGDPSWKLSSANEMLVGWFEEELCTLVGELFRTDKLTARIMRGDLKIVAKHEYSGASIHKSKVAEDLIRRAISEDSEGIIVSEVRLRD